MNKNRLKIISLFFLLMNSCGKDSNYLGYLTPKAQKETFAPLLSQARAHYDAGELDEALELGEKAYRLNPKSEEASVLLGYIYLGLAGIGPIDLVTKIMAQNEENNENDKSSLVEESEEKDSEDSFSDIKKIIGMSDSDFEKLGEWDRSDSKLPLIVPSCAGKARDDVAILGYLARAVEVVCPFVDSRLLMLDDPRHQCKSIEFQNKEKSKAHFLWAFAHLTEAVSFHSVLTYSTTQDSNKTNLELKVAKINGANVSDPTELSSYINEVKALDKTISKIMPINGKCSDLFPQTQMNALLNDLISVNQAFALMPGVPESLTKSISKATERIKEIRANSQTSGGKNENEALKGDFTKKIGEELAKKINDLEEGGQNFSEQQKSDVCDAYRSITGGSQESKPVICN